MARYDVAIIGSGPAGLEAAVNLKIRNKSVLLVGPKNLSSKIQIAPQINNYLGFPHISGAELRERFQEHLTAMGIEVTPERITTILPMGDYYMLAGTHSTFEAVSLILATGIAPTRTFPGEESFLGRGVGYCATCDAPLYKNKVVTIVGYNEEAVHEANYVAELASKVYYIPVGKVKGTLSDSVELVEDLLVEIAGENKVTHAILKKQQLDTDAVFILRDSIAPGQLLPGIEQQDGFIKVDANMATNLPGCFAAGDCTGKPHQYMRAAGQGQIAGLNAAAYIDTMNQQKKG